MNDMVGMVLGSLLRTVAAAIGGWVVKEGLGDASAGKEVGGAVILVGTLAWSWWQKYGHVQVAKSLQKLTNQATTAGAVSMTKILPQGAAIKSAVVALGFLAAGFLSLGDARAQTAKVDPAVNLAVKLKVLTADKLQAALDDANANGDPYSPQCFKALIPVVQQAQAAITNAKPAAPNAGINLVLVYQKLRDARRAAQSLQQALNGGGNVDLVTACAPMALDSETVINMVVSQIQGAAAVGVLAPK